MGQSLLAECQGGWPLTEIVAGNDGTIGSHFSEQVVPLRTETFALPAAAAATLPPSNNPGCSADSHSPHPADRQDQCTPAGRGRAIASRRATPQSERSPS